MGVVEQVSQALNIPSAFVLPAGGVLLLILILAIVFLAKGKKGKTETPAQSQVQEASQSPAENLDLRPDTQVGGQAWHPAPKSEASWLAKTQSVFTTKLNNLLLGSKEFGKDFLDSLEELLYTSDLGPKTVEKLLSAVRARLTRGELSDQKAVKLALYDEVLAILESATKKPEKSEIINPWVILVVGVNGVGKTTSIGKLAQYYTELKKRVLVVAGDTFRAAAEEQLSVWGERANVDVYTSEQTKDPAAVCFQGIQKAVAEKYDIVIVDTAGRLHNKENLMEELRKVKRVAAKARTGAPDETILVIDGNSGQNARTQAQQFNEALGVTSLIVTKLDGTARGGVIVGIAEEVGLGVQFIGVGEKLNDLQKFSNQAYAKDLLEL